MRILRWDGEIAREQSDEVVEEEPLEIRVRGRAISVTMRTPGHDAELAAGFLLTEGIIRRREDVLSIKHCAHNREQNVLNVLVPRDLAVDFQQLTRHVFASSSCGLCGKATIESIHAQFPPVRSDLVIDARILTTLPVTMRAAQATFDRTGGLHAAAVFDPSGRMIVLREDVGRHNAVDKVIGHCLLSGFYPLEGQILVVSGRSSFEIMQKALAARIPVVAAVSAPSSLAVKFADESGQTLIGFLRGDRMNVYSHSRRIAFTQLAERPVETG
jgi:FdhD protein